MKEILSSFLMILLTALSFSCSLSSILNSILEISLICFLTIFKISSKYLDTIQSLRNLVATETTNNCYVVLQNIFF